MNVEKLMTRAVKTITINDTLESAARIMWENDCGVVPVVDAEGRAVAMITDRDIGMAAYTQGRLLWELPVGSAASKTLYAVYPGDSLQAAEDLMRKHKVRRLPVVDDAGRVVGLLSLNDLARHAGRRSDDLPPEEITLTLGAICQPPAVEGGQSHAPG